MWLKDRNDDNEGTQRQKRHKVKRGVRQCSWRASGGGDGDGEFCRHIPVDGVDCHREKAPPREDSFTRRGRAGG